MLTCAPEFGFSSEASVTRSARAHVSPALCDKETVPGGRVQDRVTWFPRPASTRPPGCGGSGFWLPSRPLSGRATPLPRQAVCVHFTKGCVTAPPPGDARVCSWSAASDWPAYTPRGRLHGLGLICSLFSKSLRSPSLTPLRPVFSDIAGSECFLGSLEIIGPSQSHDV